MSIILACMFWVSLLIAGVNLLAVDFYAVY